MKKPDFYPQDYGEFVTGSQSNPGMALSHRIRDHIHSDLNPNALKVFSKLLAIHFLTAMVTLTVCPQFGYRLIGEGAGLMHLFMVFGNYGCFVACGSFFTGMSLFMAIMFLRGEEIRKIRQNRWLELGALALLSLGFFFMVDAQLIFSLTLAWLFGAVLGSVATLELGWKLRFGAAQQ